MSVWFVRQLRQNGLAVAAGRWEDDGRPGSCQHTLRRRRSHPPRNAKLLVLSAGLRIAGCSDTMSPAASLVFQHPHELQSQDEVRPVLDPAAGAAAASPCARQ